MTAGGRRLLDRVRCESRGACLEHWRLRPPNVFTQQRHDHRIVAHQCVDLLLRLRVLRHTVGSQSLEIPLQRDRPRIEQPIRLEGAQDLPIVIQQGRNGLQRLLKVAPARLHLLKVAGALDGKRDQNENEERQGYGSGNQGGCSQLAHAVARGVRNPDIGPVKRNAK